MILKSVEEVVENFKLPIDDPSTVEVLLTQDRKEIKEAVCEIIEVMKVKKPCTERESLLAEKQDIWDQALSDAKQKLSELFSLNGGKCQDCEKEKDDVSTRKCPYEEEINNTEIEVNICGDCYHERCMDI